MSNVLRMEVSGRVNKISESFKVADSDGNDYPRRNDLEEAELIAERIGGSVEVMESYLIGLCSYKVDGEAVRINPDADDYEYSFSVPAKISGDLKVGQGFNLKAESINKVQSDSEDTIFQAVGEVECSSGKFTTAKSLADLAV